ncbi:SDR family oxidoreductase [Pelagibacteraceae bacterium]|nr:SDR family oxidoreductase [Pelagibacteraceae bacterium]
MKVKYFDLENKVVFITGGGSGIGASIVEHFCEQQSKVFFVDINVDESEKLIKTCVDKKLSIPTFIKCDLKNIKETQNVIAKIIKENGPINVLINNAANDTRHSIDEVTEEYWEDRINTNLKHFFFTIQAVKKSMIENSGGAIINMGSVSWMMGEGGMPAYTTSKAAILGMTRSFARDLGPYNIRVNSVVPGSIATERQIKMWLTPEYKKLILDKQCLKRQLTPAEVAQVVMFYSSDQSSGCTNHYYMVDAGII